MLAFIGPAALLSCAHDDPGPLEVSGTTMVLEPLDQGAWFSLTGCLRDEQDSPVDVMVTSAEPSEVSGASDVDVRVAWDPSGKAPINAPGEPPSEYRPLDGTHHSGGTLTGCSLSLALVLPPTVDRPVKVRGLDITYVADDATYTTRSPVDVILCPAGTRAGRERCVDRSPVG